MALDRNLNCREFDKFVECEGEPAVRTVDCSSMVPAGYDYLENTPTATTDVFTYKSGGASGSVLGTVTVTYTDSTKCELVSVERT